MSRLVAKSRAAKKLTDWRRPGRLQVRHWLPTRKLVFVADSSHTCLDLLSAMIRLPNPITMVVRFRMEAAIRYDVYVNGVLGHSLQGGDRTILYGAPGVSNTFQVIAVDSAGNQSAPATLTTPNP